MGGTRQGLGCHRLAPLCGQLFNLAASCCRCHLEAGLCTFLDLQYRGYPMCSHRLEGGCRGLGTLRVSPPRTPVYHLSLAPLGPWRWGTIR